MPRICVDYLYLVFGAVLALTGLLLLIGGVQLLLLGGSWLYAFAGAVLIGSGLVTASGRTLGVWLYVAFFGVTFLWSLFEANGNIWAWVPRIVAPFILLLAAGALLPLRDRATYNWYQYGAGAGVLLVGFAIGAVSLYPTHLTRSGSIPETVPLATPQSRGEWTSYGADQAQRYAALDQINRTNVFVAATTDNLIRAIDIETGRTLWKDVLPAGGQATPITYAVGGQQYLVLMTGGHHFMETPDSDQGIAWTLPAGQQASPGETN